MDRYSNGIKMPKFQIDTFTALVTNGRGEVNVTLSYVPKGLNRIFVSRPSFGGPLQYYIVSSLTGKVVKIKVFHSVYDKVNTPTGQTAAMGGGPIAEPHDHPVTTTLTDTDRDPSPALNIPSISLFYDVA